MSALLRRASSPQEAERMSPQEGEHWSFDGGNVVWVWSHGHWRELNPWDDE